MKLITEQAFLFNLFKIWLQDTVGIIIYCHLFLNWCLVLWNQLKSHSVWKKTSFTWIDQLSSDTKPLVCPCSVHSLYLWLYFALWRDPVTNGQLSRWQIVFTCVSNPSSDRLWFVNYESVENVPVSLQNQTNSVTFMHWDTNFIIDLDLGIVNIRLFQLQEHKN